MAGPVASRAVFFGRSGSPFPFHSRSLPLAPVPRSLAAVVTVPGREHALAECLRSLRPQVTRLHVVCHDMTIPPDVVRHQADDWVCIPDQCGSAAKLMWVREHAGLYLACDDDWKYPADYALTMLRWVKRWKGRALVTGHGRILSPRATGFQDAEFARSPQQESKGAWLNYVGGCALAFDTRLSPPWPIPGKNLEEAHLSVWAQRQRVPIWLLPHAATWLTYLLANSNLPTIWDAEKAARFKNRNAVLDAIGAGPGWKVFHG